jgi:hypothetical protein
LGVLGVYKGIILKCISNNCVKDGVEWNEMGSGMNAEAGFS